MTITGTKIKIGGGGIFTATLFLNLGFLIILKYFNFGIYTMNGLFHLLGLEYDFKVVTWLAPVGMSFYTLQLMGYLIDIYRDSYEPQKNILKFALFACFFPQMFSGPINRHSELSPQLYTKKKFDFVQISFGLQRLLWGLFKKLVISERLAIITNTVYGDYINYSGCYIWVASFCFTLQLYTDFSGAMDVVLGISQTLGITMAENFQTPFYSQSISEFWRRWHITLGSWLREYLLYPLLKTDTFIRLGEYSKKRFGKKKGKKIAPYCGMLIVWFCVGLWHGGSYKYILGTGIFYWVIIVGGELLQPLFNKIIILFKVNTDCFSFRLFQRARTFILICITFIFFRARSFSEGIDIIKNSVKGNNFYIFSVGSLFHLGLDVPDFFIAITGLVILLIVSFLQQKYNLREKIAEQNLIFRWSIYYLLIFSIIIFGYYGPEFNPTDFIYQGF